MSTENINKLRERSDKISKIMGSYLLKRYTMLATTCNDCDTILLRKPDGKEYCVACSEIDIHIPDIITENDFVKKVPQNLNSIMTSTMVNNNLNHNALESNIQIDKSVLKAVDSRLSIASQSLLSEPNYDNQLKLLQIMKSCLDIKALMQK